MDESLENMAAMLKQAEELMLAIWKPCQVRIAVAITADFYRDAQTMYKVPREAMACDRMCYAAAAAVFRTISYRNRDR